MPIYRLGLTFLAIGLMGLLMVACPSKTVTPPAPTPTDSDAPQNNAPTDISLSKVTIPENAVANTVVGTLSTTDADADDTHVYSLIAGGSDFNISGNNLRSSKPFDFETKSSFAIKIKTDDGNSGVFEKDFTITVTDVNENKSPTKIFISKDEIAENQPANTVIGELTTIDPDMNDKHTYSVIAGGDDFNVDGNKLRSSRSFDFETEKILSITIASNDGKGGRIEQVLTIMVMNVNDGPTDIMLSSTSIAENRPANTVIGTLSTTDPDSDSHTYTLIAGGSDFRISNNSLYALKSFDFETKSSYAIKIQSDDGKGETFEKNLTITVTNVNDAPTDITLSNTSIAENRPANTVIGTLSTTDPHSDSHTYTLIAGGSDFRISNNSLYALKSFDFETKSSYAIKIRSDGGKGETFEKDFTITIRDVDGEKGTMTYNGKIYKTIQIGKQWWLAENLNDASHSKGNSACYNNNNGNCDIYGRLYDWEAAKAIADQIPGWHLATDAEWITLT